MILETLVITLGRRLLPQTFKATLNLVPIAVSCVFGNQYIMGKVLSCSVILKSNFLQYLIIVSIIFSLEYCVFDYVDDNFLFLFGETSANSLDM